MPQAAICAGFRPFHRLGTSAGNGLISKHGWSSKWAFEAGCKCQISVLGIAPQTPKMSFRRGAKRQENKRFSPLVILHRPRNRFRGFHSVAADTSIASGVAGRYASALFDLANKVLDTCLLLTWHVISPLAVELVAATASFYLRV